jgi:hypothetical protein
MEKMIAFVTTCKNRTQHLRKTLPKNLSDNASFENLKFIVLDYNSQDDLCDYLRAEHAAAIESGRLVVYSYREPGPFRMAHAKNMAHRLGMLEGADILVNLDADNFTGPGFADYVDNCFYSQRENIFISAGVVKGLGRKFRGTSGRIAVTDKSFLLVGGYDEKYETYAPDDKDFSERLKRLGHTPHEFPRNFLESVVHGDGIRFQEYPHKRDTVDEYDFEVEVSTTIANYGNFGCGTVYRNFDFETPIQLKPLPTRIFGIGMHKTATSSLDAALKILGYDSAHWETGAWARHIWEEMIAAGVSRTLEKRYALSDVPITILYEQLDAAYPGSKFILTLRDEVQWLQSVRNHWSYRKNRFRWEWNVYPFSNRIHRVIYGQTNFDALVFLERYRRHNAEVKKYFDGRNDLLVLDMDAGAGWHELCRFLDRPVPAVPYPKENGSRK